MSRIVTAACQAARLALPAAAPPEIEAAIAAAEQWAAGSPKNARALDVAASAAARAAHRQLSDEVRAAAFAARDCALVASSSSPRSIASAIDLVVGYSAAAAYARAAGGQREPGPGAAAARAARLRECAELFAGLDPAIVSRLAIADHWARGEPLPRGWDFGPVVS